MNIAVIGREMVAAGRHLCGPERKKPRSLMSGVRGFFVGSIRRCVVGGKVCVEVALAQGKDALEPALEARVAKSLGTAVLFARGVLDI